VEVVLISRIVLSGLLSAVVTAVLVSSLPADTAGDAALAVQGWADTLVIDPRVPGEIERFAGEKKKDFDDDYASVLSRKIRERVFLDFVERLDKLSKGEREPFIDVTVLDPGFATGEDSRSLGKLVAKFEKSFVRTEVLAFFDGADMTPQAALNLYTDPEFRKSISSRIKEIWDEGGERCIEIEGVKIVLSPIKYCSRIDELHRPGFSVQHSQAVRNADDKDFQTIYFKESMKAFVSVPGGLAFYYLNYSRTIGMGGIQKKIAIGKLKGSQQNAINELAVRFDQAAPRNGSGDDGVD
jgi:hypothetical protein